MAEKEKVPEPIAKFKRISDKAKKVVDTMELHHSDAYNQAAMKNIMGKDGLVDYNLLKEDKAQIGMTNDMTKYYVDKAKKFFKSGIGGKDEIENAMLMNAYAQTTQGELRQLFNKYKDDLNLNTFNAHKSELVKPIRQKLATVAATHLEKGHIDSIVKYTKADGLVNKDALGVPQAAALLTLYNRDGGITEKGLREADFEDHQLKAYSKKKK